MRVYRTHQLVIQTLVRHGSYLPNLTAGADDEIMKAKM